MEGKYLEAPFTHYSLSDIILPGELRCHPKLSTWIKRGVLGTERVFLKTSVPGGGERRDSVRKHSRYQKVFGLPWSEER